MIAESRIEGLEKSVEALAARVAQLEGVAAPWMRRPARPERPAPEPRPVAAPMTAPAPTPRLSLEDLVGGRLLAWAGGIAVLAGVVLLFAVAISNGWIGEGARTVLAAAGALALGAAGVWLHERRERTEAALVATGTSIAALFMTVTVATQVYDLVPAIAGGLLAVLVGGSATAIALRWRSQGIAALGIVGGLLAPVLAGAPASFGTMVLLWVAAAAATAVVVDRRWAWLAVTAFFVTTAQWVAYLTHQPAAGSALVVTVAFGTLNVAAAIGHELRVRDHALAPWSAVLLTLNALVLAAAGWVILDGAAGSAGADVWLAGIALAHVVGGVWALRSPRLSHETGVTVTAVGLLLADLALALVLHGAPRALAYAGGGVALAVLARRVRVTGSDQTILGAGLGGHLCLAITQLVLTDARPDLLTAAGGVSLATIGALLGVAAACFSAARVAGPGHRPWQRALDATALALVAYLTALGAGGVGLVLAWAAEAGSLAVLARRHPDRLTEAGAAAFGLLALAHGVAIEAPPVALVDGLHDVGAAAVALGCSAIAAALWPVLRLGSPGERAAGGAVAGAALLYLVSTALISGFQPGDGSSAAPLLELGVRQQGQVLLSTLWGLTGTVVVVAGLRRDVRPLRLAGLALLVAALGKLVVYDLAALGSIYRVGSCVAIGALLLLAGFVWQRLRPAAMPDLRSVPPGLR